MKKNNWKSVVTLAKFLLNFRQKSPLSIVNSATMHVALHFCSMQMHVTKLKSKICDGNFFFFNAKLPITWILTKMADHEGYDHTLTETEPQ